MKHIRQLLKDFMIVIFIFLFILVVSNFKIFGEENKDMQCHEFLALYKYITIEFSNVPPDSGYVAKDNNFYYIHMQWTDRAIEIILIGYQYQNCWRIYKINRELKC